jgi:hypothetical protein
VSSRPRIRPHRDEVLTAIPFKLVQVADWGVMLPTTDPRPGADETISRRAFAARTAVAAGAVWAAPAITTTARVAAAAGSCNGTSICEFTSGLEGWTINNSWGPGVNGLWRHDTNPARDGGSLHYGRGVGGTFRTGPYRNSGAITSGQFAIPGSGPNTVTFTVRRGVEPWPNPNYDVLRLSIRGTSNQVLYQAGSDGGTGGLFETHTITIPSGYNGQTVRFRFDFDTVDGLYNNYEGIYIGRFVVTACPPVPAAAASGFSAFSLRSAPAEATPEAGFPAPVSDPGR